MTKTLPSSSSLTEKDPGVQVVDIVVEAHEYIQELEKELKTLNHSVKISGFRPGKVPRDLLLKRFGKAIVRDLTLQKAFEKLQQHIQTEIGPFIFNPVLVYDSSVNADAFQPLDYQFTFEVAPLPHFEVALPPLGAIVWDVETVDDEKVDKEINRLRHTFGKVKLLDQAELEEDIISGSVKPLTPEESSPSVNKHISFRVRDIQKGALSQVLPVLKQGNTISFQPTEWFVISEENFSQIFKEIDRTLLERPNIKWELTISQIIRHFPAPLSEEFFREVTQTNDVKTEEEFKTFIRRRLERRNFIQARRKAHLALKDWLMAHNMGRFTLPVKFIKRKISSMSNGPLSEEEMEARIKKQQEIIAWEVILENLKNDLKLIITPDDVEKVIDELAVIEAFKYSGFWVKKDIIDKFKENIRAENSIKGFADFMVLEAKVMDRLLETVVQGYVPYFEE
ncbi:MAG: hypothetical protein NZM65_00375 [Flavobacteriales bacterium]|nr:hypothetical protein [Flavobacteriales bacterium]MDW8409124.1 trigger factor [Flavobacteriales bacterium]